VQASEENVLIILHFVEIIV